MFLWFWLAPLTSDTTKVFIEQNMNHCPMACQQVHKEITLAGYVSLESIAVKEET